MTLRIKICCIASLAEARLAVDQGAHALGLVSAMPSGPGVIDEATIRSIAAATAAPTETFLLTALQSADAIAAQHACCGTTTLQLVDAVPEAELRQLRAHLPGVRLVQVIHVQDERAIDAAQAVEPFVDALLLDSGRPDLPVRQLGGTGRVHDWSVSARLRHAVSVPVWLAGGLRPENVAAAVQRVRPHGIDVCSGVRHGGALDAERLSALVRAARDAAIPSNPD
jgi:phosphoribosylanthranilate isomerase